MNHQSTVSSERIKLGIACVYFYAEHGGWILDLQLKYLADTLSGYDYTIYAGANRLQEQLRDTLESTSRVKIVDLPHYDGTGNREHAVYLDQLLRTAAEDGCTHIAALDSDSFAILPNWPKYLLDKMGRRIRFAAVLRAENGDTHLPHPCGYFMHTSFLVDRRPQLFPEARELESERFGVFLTQTSQRVDTGIGYGHALWRSGEPWLQLRRTNSLEPHFLMAGIYGGVFFHLGASSRRPAFHQDYTTRPSLRLAARLRERPLLWRMAACLENRYLTQNTRIFEAIASRLRSDPEEFIAALEGYTRRPDGDLFETPSSWPQGLTCSDSPQR